MSDDPTVAERQKAGLDHGRPKHGAYSTARRRPLEDEHRERLRREFPQAPDDLVNTAAKRCAMLDLFAAWVEDNGPIRKGDVVPAARELRLLLTDHERAYLALEAHRGGGASRPPTLAEIAADYARDDDGAGES